MDILSLHNPPDRIAARAAAISETVVRGSQHIQQPNFERIGVEDLDRFFTLYDQAFFGGWLRRTLAAGGLSLAFRLSARMTRAGGKTVRYQPRGRAAVGGRFEIVIASRMLLMTFTNVRRPVVVCGLPCQDRLEALQRILEHEIIHLAEWLVWNRSNCSGRRFKKLAANIFGHTGTKHTLVTAREHAAVQHGLGIGQLVEFNFEGRPLVGRVNRIHRRATVLVEDTAGQRYSDGGRYQKFYVPLERLTAV